ncbi:ribonuclease H-like domain-containing protein [Desarmillaria tabescens]|uniref:DNA polymerase delta catalytic subunit n=1 Tax=Armillaria tabescens TaxID=1929756 RepID=A0AA39N4H9_ARMTA|nr:ribonuclease H-like domain-containing protein [Desarmillaria tabescens]KAK0457158.1 ribonuclease H-like domain-containing protein [Desarmillaria tabescens]
MFVGPTMPWRFSGLLSTRMTTRHVFRSRAIFRRPIAIFTGNLLSTIPGGATRSEIEGLMINFRDRLSIAANVNQRTTWRGLSTDTSTTQSLEQTNLQDLQQRPTCSLSDSLRDNIVFQLVDIQESPYECGHLLMYGVTKSGNSVLATITGFTPYLHAYPKTILDDERNVEALKNHLLELGLGNGGIEIGIVPNGPDIQGADRPLKLTFSGPNTLLRSKKLLEDAGVYTLVHPQTDTMTRFLADHQLPGMGGWIECPAQDYVLTKTSDQVSRCQIELTVPHDALNTSDSRSSDAPLRILYFDIESMTREDPKKPGKFISESSQDPVIQISNMVSHPGTRDPFLRVIFTVGSCDPIEGAHIQSYASEKEMLTAWQQFVHDVDPDVMTGWNILNFDLDYLITRSRQLKFDLRLGRLKNGPPTSSKAQKWYSLKYNHWMGRMLSIPGRVVLDMFRHFACNHDKFKLRGYALGKVAAKLLNDEPGMLKGDVAYSDIPKLQAGLDANSSTRRELAVYCLQDSYIPLVLQHKYHILEGYIEMGKTKRMLFHRMMEREEPVTKAT